MSRQIKAIETTIASLNHIDLNQYGPQHVYAMSRQMQTLLAVHIARQLDSEGLFRFREQATPFL